MIKKLFVLSLIVLVFCSSGCSLKVQRDVFYLPQDEVEQVIIQREYAEEDGVIYRQKTIDETNDLESICEKIRKLPVRRASSKEPHPIIEFPLIIIINGQKEHHLILTEEMAFYDQIAYEYTDNDTYERFLELYADLNCLEEDTEPDRF